MGLDSNLAFQDLDAGFSWIWFLVFFWIWIDGFSLDWFNGFSWIWIIGFSGSGWFFLDLDGFQDLVYLVFQDFDRLFPLT